MKTYQLRNAILDLLIRIEKDQSFSHLLIDHEIKSGQIKQKDEGLLTEVVYGTLQREMTLDYYLDSFMDSKKKMEPWVRILLRMSLYQMLFLDKVPDHAIIHEAVEIAKHRGHRGIAGFVNGVLRNVQRNGVPDTALIEDPVSRISIETSHPKWLVARWTAQYGIETTKAMCEANVNKKSQSIRIQPLKISREEAMEILKEQGYSVIPSRFSSQGIIIEKGNILHSSLFKDGLITIQDQSSMLVAEMLDAKPSMEVLDACSAPGGKATHIAEKMENQGSIKAYDLHKKKVNLIANKAKSLGLTIIDANANDARKLHEIHAAESFDRIVVDAPCSGLGVIRGKPEIKYNKNENDIERLSEIQLDILERVAPLLKKDGLLVYSTCTVDKQENEQVVKSFIESNPDFEVDSVFFEKLPDELKASQGKSEFGLQLFPQNFDTDGFFLTRLKRKK
ncbi:16S rRNA (cytosine(967)-C(5))-methyltransferase RsmB [Oceanobacillus chungangensis]|uniref:16S rRNA (cytosine(967)-C(5))-methyltransferase n=1 Tax=Oceanobacillus chungangensis TaxID=1229152 RepID=A0A3D8PP48_9BACI|nr:16S rRNA (cytosine(967)-C(5))-methyltransferase RsmB [Oceanobacillus chungangensis]RDW17886.1 16S rRNA (cytosine(967)-C(5))-methyltransferase [Oceanobacillus chungangensis]